LNICLFYNFLETNLKCIMLESAIEIILTHVYSISDEYGVNPLIFGFLYFSTVPLFWVSIFYLGKNFKQKESLTMPILGIIFSQVLCYIYLFSTAENLPGWVYALIFGIIAYTAYRVWQVVSSKLKMEVEQS
jgi:hypothetical protein